MRIGAVRKGRVSQLHVRDEGHFFCITQIVDVGHDLVIEEYLLILVCPEVLVLVQEHFISNILRQLRRVRRVLVRLLCVFLQVILWREVLERTLPVPRSLRHWRVDLLEVEFILDRLLVDVGYHVRRLDERHRERGPHPQSERALRHLL